ncbi:MAG: UDP-N-acetylmuramoyl-L-alanyl-D-glutamate--2,6-diaminopimelate ligase [Candidatus Omnitrophica bacterium]|nr:UDP-N-acetylmuramoyl-L-alanyl-D-glutamate--2,6-diaminopimelate ligase [Candidatus Omnitrophota bacterium]
MKLEQLLQGIYKGHLDACFEGREISSISCDSRGVTAGTLFVAVDGTQLKGSDFIDSAIEKGAGVIIFGSEVPKKNFKTDVCYLRVDDPKEFLKKITLKFYSNPSLDVRVIGITGTNGKTTTTYLIESILKTVGKASGVVGTINYRVAGQVVPSKNTTPGFIDNQKILAQLREEHIPYCVMEVSSHGLDQGRVDAIDFKQAIFTNLTNDHLDYHGTMEKYFEAKAKLFTSLSSKAVAIINKDDPFADQFMKASSAKVLTYSVDTEADICAKNIHLDVSRMTFELNTPKGKIVISSPFVGKHNIYNILAAASSAFAEGISLEDIKKGVEALHCVPGRLEPVVCGQSFPVLIDYAHTPDALENVLKTLRQFKNLKVILIFGCGGDRDKTKRPMMGKVASRLADFSIITTDNPRSEDPEDIIKQIVAGVEGKNYQVIVDRTQAISEALRIAKRGDVVLIAGKGHETYQIFKDKTIDFDERKVIKDFLHPTKKGATC